MSFIFGSNKSELNKFSEPNKFPASGSMLMKGAGGINMPIPISIPIQVSKNTASGIKKIKSRSTSRSEQFNQLNSFNIINVEKD
jgi:hypothetical protein